MDTSRQDQNQIQGGTGQGQVTDDSANQAQQGVTGEPEQPGYRPGHGVEQQPMVGASENVKLVEVGEEVAEREISPEVAEYVQRVEETNQQTGHAVVRHVGDDLEVVQDEEPKIVLPMTKQNVLVGLKKKVRLSARWLAEWCVRLIKKFHGRVIYSRD